MAPIQSTFAQYEWSRVNETITFCQWFRPIKVNRLLKNCRPFRVLMRCAEELCRKAGPSTHDPKYFTRNQNDVEPANALPGNCVDSRSVKRLATQWRCAGANRTPRTDSKSEWPGENPRFMYRWARKHSHGGSKFRQPSCAATTNRYGLGSRSLSLWLGTVAASYHCPDSTRQSLPK